jgi:hypothetical protein
MPLVPGYLLSLHPGLHEVSNSAPLCPFHHNSLPHYGPRRMESASKSVFPLLSCLPWVFVTAMKSDSGPISTFILYFWSVKSTFNKGNWLWKPCLYASFLDVSFPLCMVVFTILLTGLGPAGWPGHKSLGTSCSIPGWTSIGFHPLLPGCATWEASNEYWSD